MKKLILFTALLVFFALNTWAQSHLKDVQATSVWAPANVKIDGNVNEWEDSFQAYNKTTKLFYTLSNNNKYLYLAVYCTDAANNTKIVAGGITFTINTAGRKKDKDAYVITYPVIARRTRGQRGGGGGFGGGGFRGAAAGAGTDTAAVAAAHKQLIASSKEIKVFGFKAIDDTLISIYNEYGIKAAIGFDGLGNYQYELAVPLTLLNLSPGARDDIAYNIKVNGLQVNANIMARLNGADGGGGGFGGGGGAFAADGGGGGGGFGGGRGGGRGGAPGGGTPGGRAGNLDMADLTNPTDFWAKYTLAKQ